MEFGQRFRKWLRETRSRVAKSRTSTFKTLVTSLRSLVDFRQQ